MVGERSSKYLRLVILTKKKNSISEDEDFSCLIQLVIWQVVHLWEALDILLLQGLNIKSLTLHIWPIKRKCD